MMILQNRPVVYPVFLELYFDYLECIWPASTNRIMTFTAATSRAFERPHPPREPGFCLLTCITTCTFQSPVCSPVRRTEFWPPESDRQGRGQVQVKLTSMDVQRTYIHVGTCTRHSQALTFGLETSTLTHPFSTSFQPTSVVPSASQ